MYFTRFASKLSLEAAEAAYREARSARKHARRTSLHRDLGRLEDALLVRITHLKG